MKKLFGWFFVAVLFYACSENEEHTLPLVMDLTESVYSSVTVQPDSLYQVYASVSGILDNVFVEEGDNVQKNTPLVGIVNNTPKIQSQNAWLSLELSKEKLSGKSTILQAIEDEIKAAKLAYQLDSVNYFRQKKLWESNVGSKVEYDAQKLQFQLSANNLKLLENKYQRTKKELETAVKHAENNYKSSLVNTKDFTIESKINGKVYALYKNPGEIITSMEPLASIGSAKVFIIEMLVDEVDIVKLKTDQEVLITLDAYNGQIFTGKISKIYPKKDERNQTFKVEATFDDAPEVLYPGLSGEANIVISTKKEVLVIPKEYVMDENKIKTDSGIVEIATGLQNLEHIEVLSGITKDTYIYKPKR